LINDSGVWLQVASLPADRSEQRLDKRKQKYRPTIQKQYIWR